MINLLPCKIFKILNTMTKIFYLMTCNPLNHVMNLFLLDYFNCSEFYLNKLSLFYINYALSYYFLSNFKRDLLGFGQTTYPEGNLQVFSAPNVHPRVISSDFKKEFSVCSEQPACHCW